MAILLAWATGVGAAVIQETEIELTVNPAGESMDVVTRLHIADNTGDRRLVCYFLEPANMEYLRELNSGWDVPYTFESLSLPEYGVYEFTMNLNRLPAACLLELSYRYTGEEFYGWSLNPSTLDNLVLGQIRQDSVYASHLLYYPFPEIATGRGHISIIVPEGWTGVTAGILESHETLADGRWRFAYDIPYASGLLPYPLAVYPYVVEETIYADRVPVSIYCCQDDAHHAREKLEFVTTKALPFLEELMGEYPWPNVRIVEVFPDQGNTGLAAKGLVMLSQAMWFAEAIGDAYTSLPAIVLVDELAHQWNAYRVQLPNFLAEGISEYTDNLFLERFVGPEILAANMATYRDAYASIVKLMEQLRSLRQAGATIEEAAAQLNMTVDDVAPYWPFAPYGELPITDPRVFPTLYFLKGALAIHALRAEVGDDPFFLGFRTVFAGPDDEPLTLDYFQECFETAHSESLEAFFHRWYYEPGLPEDADAAPPGRRRAAGSG